MKQEKKNSKLAYSKSKSQNEDDIIKSGKNIRSSVDLAEVTRGAKSKSNKVNAGPKMNFQGSEMPYKPGRNRY